MIHPNLETADVKAKVKVDVVIKRSMPSVLRRKASRSAISQNMSSSVNTG
jgi:hypothetical protein